MSQRRFRVSNLEIDEVSTVDVPANQGGLIAIAKNHQPQEGFMPDEAFFDASGVQIDADNLQHGDVAFDNEGNEIVFLDEDSPEYAQAVGELAEVGKAGFGDAVASARQWGAGAMKDAKRFKAGFKSGIAGNSPEAALKGNPYGRGNTAGNAVWGQRNKYQRAGIVAAPGVAVAGAGYGMSKSAGDQILEALSKAATEDDRNAIVAKMADELNASQTQLEEIVKAYEAMEDERITDAFISKAATYNLPVAADVLGPILKSAATVLTDEQLDVLDDLLNSVGDILYGEVGYVGDTDNQIVTDQVDAYARELVGKSAGQMTHEQASVAIYEANPQAYEAYLAQIGR